VDLPVAPQLVGGLINSAAAVDSWVKPIIH
jgi:hypothetical protein